MQQKASVLMIFQNHLRGGTVRSVAVAAAVAAVVAVVLPLQSFLGNESLYPFGMGRLVVELGVAFVAVAALLAVVFAIVGRRARGVVQWLVVAAAACAYLEAGPLSAGLPEINGAFAPELSVASRSVWDCCAWIVLLIGALAAARWLPGRAHFAAAALAVLAFASLFDVRRDGGESPSGKVGGGLASGFEWQRDIVENFKFSRERNVLVFILDSVPGSVSTDVIKSSPDIAAKFTGFVAFTNNVGMHDCTKRGLPGLMTGKYFEPESSSKAEYPMSVYGGDSFLTHYVEAGAEASFVPDLFPYGYTNAKVEKRMQVKGRQKHGWAALLLRSKEVPYLSLFDVTVFRIAPYVAKAPFLYAKIRHDPMFGQDESNFWYEHAMYPRLAAAGFTNAKTVLGVFHSRGAHPPLAFDRHGNRLGKRSWAREALPDLVLNPLYNLAGLMDVLRENGVYDKSLIVVAADHGVSIAPHAPEHHPSESAILWVKPEGASGPLVYSGTPTGYSKVAALMKSAVAGKPCAAEVEAALREENRLFRYLDANDHFHDIMVGPNWEIVSKKDF